jgi:predicted porin
MVGAILTGGMAAAHADVTVFGQIDESINRIDNAAGDSDTSLICTTCSLGFKGSEDLGNGLKAIFKIDFQYNINQRNPKSTSVVNSVGTTGGGATVTSVGNTNVSKTNAITDRDQWLGLAGNFGQVRVGTISTIYKSQGAKVDPIYRTVAQQRDIGIQSRLHAGAGSNGQGRAENTVRYDTPSWNGLSGAATYTITPDNENDGDNGYSAGLAYENGGILVQAAYVTNDRGGDDDAASLSAKYTLNNFSVFGMYEYDGGLITDVRRGTLGANDNGDGADQWMLGGTYTMGNNMIDVAYGQGDGIKGTQFAGPLGADDYKSWEIVGVHNMSKRTFVYGGYVKIDPDDSNLDDTTHFTAGMRHSF